MRQRDKRDIKCNELAEKFEQYIDLKNAHDYLDAKLIADAPDSAKKAHKEYIELSKEILSDREKSPFM